MFLLYLRPLCLKFTHMHAANIPGLFNTNAKFCGKISLAFEWTYIDVMMHLA